MAVETVIERPWRRTGAEAGRVHAERQGRRRSRRREPHRRGRSAMASRSPTFATRKACGRMATAAPAWSRSRASVCWRRHAAAIPPTAWRSRPTAHGPLTSQKMVLELLLSDVPETSYTLDSELDLWARRLSVGKPRFAARHQPVRGRLAPGDRGEPRRLHPVRPLRARLPRRTGQRRHRLRLPRLGTRRSSSTSTIRWANPRASPAANASRRVRPARSCPRARSGRSSPTSRWSRCARTAAWGASSPTTSRPTRFSSCRARTVLRTRAGCASRAATASTTCSTSIA